MTRNPPRLLTIAGSDSGGGAGIQADIKTFTALGGHGMSVITAITAQNSTEVRAVVPLSAEAVAQQFLAVIEDLGVDAAKTGMCHNADIINTIAHLWQERGGQIPLVVDPVMITSSGHTLLDEDGLKAMKKSLLPLASLLTPNLDEALLLLGYTHNFVRNTEHMQNMAQELLQLGCQAVLIKGGHLMAGDRVWDVYAHRDGDRYTFRHQRVHTRNTHGTGCTLSAAITNFLGRGMPMREAIGYARRYLLGALKAGAAHTFGDQQLGHGPLFHAFRVPRS